MDKSKQRVYILDMLRGISIAAMIVQHAMISYEIIFGRDVYLLHIPLMDILHFAFVAIFILISGICTNYSHNIMKRGLIVFAMALVVSAVTCLLLPEFGLDGLQIYFGILHMFGISMILYALLKKYLEKINPAVGSVIFTVLFAAYYVFYSTEPVSDSYLLMIFGVLPKSIVEYGDYFPLLPYFFLFVAGGYIGKYVKAGKLPERFYTVRCKPFEFIGKYSLYFYLIHQPIVFSALLLFYNFTS